MYRPLAWSKTLALSFAALLTITVVTVLSARLNSGRIRDAELENVYLVIGIDPLQMFRDEDDVRMQSM